LSDPSKEWLGLSAAARMLGIHPSTLRAWADRGEVPSQRTAGGHRRFKRADLEVWAAARRTSQPSEVQVVVQNAIGRTRLELADGRLGQQGWYQKLNEEQRTRYREGSRRLMRELIHSSQLEPAQTEAEAHVLGSEYARISRQASLSLKEAVAAYLFFREFLFESIFNVYETAGVRSSTTWAETRRKVSGFTNQVLLALIEAYSER
jgi:excisionase family DNA binding protein